MNPADAIQALAEALGIWRLMCDRGETCIWPHGDDGRERTGKDYGGWFEGRPFDVSEAEALLLLPLLAMLPDRVTCSTCEGDAFVASMPGNMSDGEKIAWSRLGMDWTDLSPRLRRHAAKLRERHPGCVERTWDEPLNGAGGYRYKYRRVRSAPCPACATPDLSGAEVWLRDSMAGGPQSGRTTRMIAAAARAASGRTGTVIVIAGPGDEARLRAMVAPCAGDIRVVGHSSRPPITGAIAVFADHRHLERLALFDLMALAEDVARRFRIDGEHGQPRGYVEVQTWAMHFLAVLRAIDPDDYTVAALSGAGAVAAHRDALAVFADRLQAEGDRLGEWLALWLTRAPCEVCDGDGDELTWLREANEIERDGPCIACDGSGLALVAHTQEMAETAHSLAEQVPRG